jgi:hypothetical protein
MSYLYKLHAPVVYGYIDGSFKARLLSKSSGSKHNCLIWMSVCPSTAKQAKNYEVDPIMARHGAPHLCVVVAYSSQNIGWTWSLEIACAEHSLSLSHALPYLLSFLWSSLSTRAAPIHKGRLPRYTVATTTLLNTPVLVRAVTCLTLMTYLRNHWLQRVNPISSQCSFSRSNLAVRKQSDPGSAVHDINCPVTLSTNFAYSTPAWKGWGWGGRSRRAIQ